MTRSKNYEELLKSPQWQVKRKIILERDRYMCRNCATTAHLQVHHRQYHIYRRTGEYVPPWGYQNKYLLTLCNKCHIIGHLNYQVPVFTI
jgi:5-methylcytosine-specific restriction endonuclease McrA